MIRLAEESDFGEILHLSEIFWGETEFDDVFDPNHVLQMIYRSMGCGLLAVVDVGGKAVGFVAGIVGPLLGNANALVAAELAYFILPEHRGKGIELLRFYEDLARAQGVKYNTMMSLQSCEPDKANRIYEKMGYHLTEMTYLKVV